MHETAAGKAHKFRLHISQQHSNILAQPVAAAEISLLREQGYQIKLQSALPAGQNDQPAGIVGAAGGKHRFVFLPLR
ncbi:hypothetical protein D3C76_1448160 [compost metagenome]